MGTLVLGGAVRSVDSATPGRICDTTLDLFESEDTDDRARAVTLCADCPLLAGCRSQTRTEILDSRGPVGVVRAGIAWDDDGQPDADIHTTPQGRSWVPTTDANAEPDVDAYVVELAFNDPGRIRDAVLTPAETDAIILQAAERGQSMNWIRKLLGIHPRAVDQAARRLGVRDRFGSKSSRPRKAAPAKDFGTPVDLDATAPDADGFTSFVFFTAESNVATPARSVKLSEQPNIDAHASTTANDTQLTLALGIAVENAAGTDVNTDAVADTVSLPNSCDDTHHKHAGTPPPTSTRLLTRAGAAVLTSFWKRRRTGPVAVRLLGVVNTVPSRGSSRIARHAAVRGHHVVAARQSSPSARSSDCLGQRTHHGPAPTIPRHPCRSKLPVLATHSPHAVSATGVDPPIAKAKGTLCAARAGRFGGT